MTWIILFLLSGVISVGIYFIRKQALDEKKTLDMEAALRRNAEAKAKSATIDASTATNRSRLRQWLRIQKL